MIDVPVMQEFMDTAVHYHPDAFPALCTLQTAVRRILSEPGNDLDTKSGQIVEALAFAVLDLEVRIVELTWEVRR